MGRGPQKKGRSEASPWDSSPYRTYHHTTPVPLANWPCLSCKSQGPRDTRLMVNCMWTSFRDLLVQAAVKSKTCLLRTHIGQGNFPSPAPKLQSLSCCSFGLLVCFGFELFWLVYFIFLGQWISRCILTRFFSWRLFVGLLIFPIQQGCQASWSPFVILLFETEGKGRTTVIFMIEEHFSPSPFWDRPKAWSTILFHTTAPLSHLPQSRDLLPPDTLTYFYCFCSFNAEEPSIGMEPTIRMLRTSSARMNTPHTGAQLVSSLLAPPKALCVHFPTLIYPLRFPPKALPVSLSSFSWPNWPSTAPGRGRCPRFTSHPMYSSLGSIPSSWCTWREQWA